jgi:hypothetical protein
MRTGPKEEGRVCEEGRARKPRDELWVSDDDATDTNADADVGARDTDRKYAS